MTLTPAEFKQIRIGRGFDHAQMGRFLGGYTARQVYRWEAGTCPVPSVVDTLLWVLFKVCDDALEGKLKRRNRVF